MPLPMSSSEDLQISESEFDANGLAVIMLAGGRYGGDWVVRASTSADGEALGEFRTASGSSKAELQRDPAYPYLAVETAFIWLMGQAPKREWRVVHFECLNHRYDKAERPFFCLAQAIIANRAFTPAPGVTYADQLSLDAVMGYAAS